MTKMAAGKKLDLLVGLGNGFDTTKGDRPLLIGGGVGAPPLLGLAKAILARGAVPRVALGFAAKEDAVLVGVFENMNLAVRVALVTEGRVVTDLLPEWIPLCDHYYTCGPEAMLQAVHQACPMDGQLSFEARMACGFGACMGCTCGSITGGKRVCKDGPVFSKKEIVW
jgi:dihydroorotate dehydrogenase electron transfer subunit